MTQSTESVPHFLILDTNFLIDNVVLIYFLFWHLNETKAILASYQNSLYGKLILLESSSLSSIVSKNWENKTFIIPNIFFTSFLISYLVWQWLHFYFLVFPSSYQPGINVHVHLYHSVPKQYSNDTLSGSIPPRSRNTPTVTYYSLFSPLREARIYFLQVCSYDKCTSDLCNWVALGTCTVVHCFFAQVKLDLTQCLWLHQYKCTLSSIIYDICTEIH